VFEQFGIPVAQVLEVVRPTGLRPVPGAPIAQLGILNVRGTIVTVLDLGALRTGARAVLCGSIVLLAYGGRSIGLAIERVVDVRPAGAGGTADHDTIIPLDAVALCARFLHSAEETDG
jgi:purine-binding chemotaxis protein CheW